MNIQDIKKILKNRRISYDKLSKDTNISRSTLADIFRGKTQNPRMDTLQIICNYLNLKEEDIFYQIQSQKFNVSNDDEKLLKNFHSLTDAQQEVVRMLIEGLIEETVKK